MQETSDLKSRISSKKEQMKSSKEKLNRMDIELPNLGKLTEVIQEESLSKFGNKKSNQTKLNEVMMTTDFLKKKIEELSH